MPAGSQRTHGTLREPAIMSDHNETSALGRRRRRPATACVECRRRKVSCDKKTPCSRCVRGRVQCIYTALVSPSERGATGQGPPGSQSSVDTSQPNTVQPQPHRSTTSDSRTLTCSDSPGEPCHEPDSFFGKTRLVGRSHWYNSVVPVSSFFRKHGDLSCWTSHTISLKSPSDLLSREFSADLPTDQPTCTTCWKGAKAQPGR